ncbi:GNAT family acetyltransferase [Natronomonas pharaonis DSM 2160]|uniref:GNAT family acetyltransferase n=1 Tax=Natronomonas pharaonis (strain ATCC 35678 / DSM 2160 / CIP 103997 / JCM 8858 / NBRC 14720 / NCIMB 2260 / Gabara) TaxID=348780 RepID=A0A1U7EUZ0_NATPD|nr:GNAT family N-acetyltransferase [Natronomonas pharaonis]CAI48828.1 GNAT family acetyltransferase [Natronomonas pharaonis DSM 2160]
MYVRDARNRDEAWLLDHIEAMGLDETSFRSRDYVIAVDEESNARAGFGRIRVHSDDGTEVCELTSIGVLDGWRRQGVGAHVIERLVDSAETEAFERVYSLTSAHDYLAQFGFEPVAEAELPDVLAERLEAKQDTLDPDAVPMRLDIDAFGMPERLRERFKTAAEDAEPAEPPEEAEDFGIDPDEATYKYDTGS